MSLNQTPLEVIQEIAPVVNLSRLNKRQYGAYNGGTEVSYQTYPAQALSNSQIQLTTIPPSDRTIIDPMNIKAKVTYRLTFTGTSASGNLIQLGTADAPRYMPFSQTCATQQCNLNGGTISSLTSQWLQGLQRYQDFNSELSREFTAPTQQDKCIDYADLFGRNASPFTLFGENDYQKSRGGYSGITIVSNTPTSAVVDLTTTEPILISGIYYNKYGLCNVKNLSWLFTFGDLRRVWSHDAVNGNVITNLSVNITAFSMQFRFITPKLLSGQEIPQSLIYNYNELVPMNQSSGVAIAPGASTTINVSAVNLQAVPKAIYIWAQKDQSAQTFDDADSYFRINNVSINFMNKTGLLNSASFEGLYDICKENGYNGDYDMFNKYNGSVICVKVGKDIGLSDRYAPGLLDMPQLSMKIDCTNLSSVNSIAPTVYCYILYEGVLELGANGSFNRSTSVLSSMDVVNSSLAGAKVIEAKEHVEKSYYGGSSLIDDLISVGKSLVDVAEKSVGVGARVAPYVGLGVVGGRRRKGRRGGDLVDRDELMNASEEYYE